MDDRTASTSKPQQPTTTTGSIKETIEAILIAFILAFVFRAFVVEAFIIPTGSMAPTLLGAHMRFTCPDCGYAFPVNYSSIYADDQETVIPNVAEPLRGERRIFSIRCPNCGLHFPRPLATAPAVHYGDRILVLKYLYLFQDPRRWDVVVFKSPAEPAKSDYSQNFIKRLVGKPGETIMILDGDIYVQRADESTFTVQTKPRDAQEALWRIIYDNDYYPQQKVSRVGGEPWKQPWTPLGDGDGWDLAPGAITGKTFAFDNPTGAASLWFDPNADFGQHAFTDWLPYDVTHPAQVGSRPQPRAADTSNSGDGVIRENVSDLKLSLFYQRQEGDGPLRLSLSKLDDTFIAEIRPTEVALLHRTGSGPAVALGSPVPLTSTGRPLHIEFTNADYQATLRIDGHDLITTTPEQYHPDIPRLLNDYANHKRQPQPRVQITADRQRCQLSHVGLWRDVYYLNEIVHWGTPARPIKLNSGEYFVLGDNSLISGDARYWTDPIDLPNEDLRVASGRVPARFLFGKAFFVYWPAGFRPVSDTAPGVVPNFGDMRFIH